MPSTQVTPVDSGQLTVDSEQLTNKLQLCFNRYKPFLSLWMKPRKSLEHFEIEHIQLPF
jgi:hypothetical protein